MNRFGMTLQWAPVVLALVVFLGAPAGAQISNGGFEQVDAQGRLANWTAVPDSATVRADQPGRGGKTSARMLVVGPKTSTGLMSAPISVLSGGLYVVSGWARLNTGSGTRRALVRVRWLSDRLQVLAFQDEASSQATTETWTQVAATVRAPDGAHFAQMVCVAECRAPSDAPFEAWFDDVALMSVDGVAPAQITVLADSMDSRREAQVHVVVRDSLGEPAGDGIAVRFFSDRGFIDDWIATQKGAATATLRYKADQVGGAFVQAQVGHLSAAISVGDLRAAALAGRVYDANSGLPLAARVVLTDSLGHPWDARHPVREIAEGAFDLSVPPGRVWITVDRGPEYVPPEPQALTLVAGMRLDVDLPLRPWTHMADHGWVAGDLLVRPHGEDQRWAIGAEDAVRLSRAMGLRFALFADGLSGHIPDQDALATDLQSDGFWPLLGRVITGDLGRQWVLGGGALGTFDASTPGFVVQALAHQGRGLVGYTRPFEEKHLAAELPFDALAGPSFDALDVMSLRADDDHAQRLWFALLNRGFRVVGTASSHAILDGVNSNRLGRFRTYVHVGGDVTAGKLNRALADGQVVVSSGPLLQFSVFAAGPGSDLPVGRPRRAALRAWASGDRDDYLTRIELIRNAEVVQAWDLSDHPRAHRMAVTLRDSVACWYVARCYGADSTRVALTNPIFFSDEDKAPPEPVQAVVRGTVQTVDGAPVPEAVVEVLNPLGDVVLQTAARGGHFQVWAPPTAHIRVTAKGFGGQTLRIVDDADLRALLRGLRDGPPEALYADKTFTALVDRLHQIEQVFTLAPQR